MYLDRADMNFTFIEKMKERVPLLRAKVKQVSASTHSHRGVQGLIFPDPACRSHLMICRHSSRTSETMRNELENQRCGTRKRRRHSKMRSSVTTSAFSPFASRLDLIPPPLHLLRAVKQWLRLTSEFGLPKCHQPVWSTTHMSLGSQINSERGGLCHRTS